MDANSNDQENGLARGMEDLERELDEENYDVNSVEFNTRDASLCSALNFNPGLNGSRTKSSSNERRTSKIRKSGPRPASVSSGPRSRAPPKKPYEPAPFLSIDNLPEEKRDKQPEVHRKERSKSTTTSYSHGMKVPSNTPNGHYGMGMPGRVSGMSMSCSSTEWNRMVPRSKHRTLSKQAGQALPNGHVSCPFKQSTSTANSQRSYVAPDQALKEMTVMATYEVAKAIAKTRPETEKKIQGRLLKARLKPLNTVNVTGPTIHHCRGIVAGAHGYLPSPNRTLQRRRHLLNNLNSNYMRDRPQTAESLHHTSVASESTGVHENDDLDYLLMGNTEPQEDFGIPPSSLASYNERILSPPIDQQGRYYQEFKSPRSPDEATNQQPVINNVEGQRSTEGHNDEEDPDIQEVTEAEKYFLDADDDLRTKNNQQLLADDKSPRRPKSTYDGSLRKSVRFADSRTKSSDALHERSHSAMPGFRPDRVPNPRLTEQVSKQKSRSSCRPEDVEVNNSWEDDTDRDRGGGSARGLSRAWSDNNNVSNRTPSQSSGVPPRGGQTSGENKDDESEVLRTSFGEVQFGFDDCELSNQRPPSQLSVRPRSRLGEWEDVMKPDDCGDMIISGQGKDITERESEVPRRSAGAYSYNGRRPQSAKAPYDQIMEERRQMNQKQRPASARADCTSLDHTMYMSTAVLNQRPQSAKKTTVLHFRPPSAKVKPAAPKATPVVSTKRIRPSSGRNRRPTSSKARKVKISQGNGDHDNTCSYCGNLTNRGIDYKTGNYFSVCKDCRKQCGETNADVDSFTLPRNIDCECHDMNTNVVAKCLARDIIEQTEHQVIEQGTDSCIDSMAVSNNKADVPYKGMQYGRQGVHGSTVMYKSKVIYSAAEQTQQDVAKLTDAADFVHDPTTQKQEVNDLEIESSNLEPESVNQTGKGQILMSLDDLDKSLTDVQKEIKACLTNTSADTGSQDQSNQSEISKYGMESCSEKEQIGVTFQPPAGEFSTKLIGDSDHQWEAVESKVTVYQFVEKPLEFESQDSQSHDLNDHVTSGNITTYSTAMMSPLQQSTGQPTPVKRPDSSSSKSQRLANDVSSLEVRATSAHIRSQTSESESHPLAPHPALVSPINARPPHGYMYYFAYGMDMNPDRLSTYIHREVAERFWGLLFGFKLLFNKKGVDKEAGGFPNLELCVQSSVEGSLQLITESELNSLDKYMGYPEHYEHVMLPVWQLNCSEADELGVAQYCVPAVMYVAKDRWTHRGPAPLDGSYAADQCLKGSTFLSPGYTDQLRQHRDYIQ